MGGNAMYSSPQHLQMPTMVHLTLHNAQRPPTVTACSFTTLPRAQRFLLKQKCNWCHNFSSATAEVSGPKKKEKHCCDAKADFSCDAFSREINVGAHRVQLLV